MSIKPVNPLLLKSMRCNSHNRKILQIIQKLKNDPSVSDGTPLVHCIVIFSYKHYMVTGVPRTVIIMLFILPPNCEKKIKIFTHTLHTPFSTTLHFSPGENPDVI